MHVLATDEVAVYASDMRLMHILCIYFCYRASYASAVLAVVVCPSVCLSVHLSVCLSQAGIVSKRQRIESRTDAGIYVPR